MRHWPFCFRYMSNCHARKGSLVPGTIPKHAEPHFQHRATDHTTQPPIPLRALIDAMSTTVTIQLRSMGLRFRKFSSSLHHSNQQHTEYLTPRNSEHQVFLLP